MSDEILQNCREILTEICHKLDENMRNFEFRAMQKWTYLVELKNAAERLFGRKNRR